MRSKTILLIVPQSDQATAPLIEAVLDGWRSPSGPEVRPIDFGRIIADQTPLKSARLVWIYAEALDEVTRPLLDEVMAMVEEAQTPAALTIAGDSRLPGESNAGGIIIAPPGAAPQTIAAVLRALWAQAQVLDDLRAELRLLQTHQGGLCDQMDKIDEELRLAAQLQREFLPTTLPSMNGVEFEVLYRPAGYVSGDIYDVLRLDEDHIGFFLGDAVGHGVPAALMTMYIKRSLHVKEVDAASPRGYRIVPPDAALAKLNRDMCQQDSGNVRFATACYGVINCKTRELTFARAGHPLPMILRHDGAVETMESEGAMLGIFPEEEYELIRRQLDHGDRLVLYSDGFEVAFPDVNEQTGQPRLANHRYEEEFKNLANGPLKKAIQNLESKLDRQAGSLNQQDDMTIVCMSIGSAAAVAANLVPAPVMAKAG